MQCGFLYSWEDKVNMQTVNVYMRFAVCGYLVKILFEKNLKKLKKKIDKTQ